MRGVREKAVMAGVDVDMASGLFRTHLPALVREGRVPMARIDEAAARVLRVKFRLGRFEAADKARRIDPKAAVGALATPETRAAARDVARKSIVLLENRGAILPLERLYPLPTKELAEDLEKYRHVSDIRWVQDEPENQGAYQFMQLHLPGALAAAMTGYQLRMTGVTRS